MHRNWPHSMQYLVSLEFARFDKFFKKAYRLSAVSGVLQALD